MGESLRCLFSRGSNVHSYHRRAIQCLLLPAIILWVGVAGLPAAQVRVPEGTMVPLALRLRVTTGNVVKGDRVDFEVVNNVIVDNHVVIPKGATGWGTVVKVRGAGRNDAKDASVTFRIIGVHGIDSQPIALRLLPSKSKKQDPTENDIEESGVITEAGERMIGAPKGKQYAAYTDSQTVVNAPNSAPPPALEAAPAQSAAASSVAPASAVRARAPAAPPDALLAPEPASVDFRSQPAGADIVIDGASVGVTPATLQLSPGLHEIEIHASGYQNWKRRMRVAPGSHPTVLAHMVKE